MGSDPKTLSALVVIHNEAGQLADCLAGVAFADEIVVVLDRCTDASRAIAQAFGARLVEGAFEREGPRRAAGVAACSGPFILEVDADERVTPALASEIRAVLSAAGPDTPAFWRIPFDNYIGARLVRYGWGAKFGVGAKAALFRKGVKSWGDERVHPKVELSGAFGHLLENRMLHYVDDGVGDMLARLDRYTTLNALDLAENGKAGSYGKNVSRIFGRFWKCFVRRKGYREGGLGLLIAIFAGLYPFLSYMKMQELLAKNGKDPS